jgi:hypothetical protein
MGNLWVGLFALVLLGAPAAGIDVHGTARFKDKPLSDAVV